MRLITATFPEGHADSVTATFDDHPGANWTVGHPQDGMCEAQLLVGSGDTQTVVDRLQSLLASADNWRIVVLPVEAAVLPKHGEDKIEAKEKSQNTMALREEIYHDVSQGARVNRDFIALTMLSAIVAALGINADNVAVVIGAMVIAPLLGPILAFSFSCAIGNLELMWRSAQTALVGLSVGVATGFCVGTVIPVDLSSGELLSRTDVGLDAIALALASGAAAALSVLTGLSATLVGVMVAVAILPPAVAVALFLAAGEIGFAAQAIVLLAINVVSVNLASQLVFFTMGVRPRTWLERRSAQRSTAISISVWAVLLVALVVLLLFSSG